MAVAEVFAGCDVAVIEDSIVVAGSGCEVDACVSSSLLGLTGAEVYVCIPPEVDMIEG